MATIGLWIGYVGMAIAIVAGALWPNPHWAAMAAGLGVLGIGILVKRKAGAPPIEEEQGDAAKDRVIRTGTLADGVRVHASGVAELSKLAPTLHLEEVKKKVEELIYLGPARLGEAQEAVSARLGFPSYAEVMGPLATSERLLYRAWSAASDGHRPEVLASLREAQPYADQAAEASDRVLTKLS
ncbi:MAG: hypothetical protein HY791_18340 [Deltaproteobacteria bacterium]|nr:hypothetical protein [Deltaproteobacteria bacterium]